MGKCQYGRPEQKTSQWTLGHSKKPEFIASMLSKVQMLIENRSSQQRMGGIHGPIDKHYTTIQARLYRINRNLQIATCTSNFIIELKDEIRSSFYSYMHDPSVNSGFFNHLPQKFNVSLMKSKQQPHLSFRHGLLSICLIIQGGLFSKNLWFIKHLNPLEEALVHKTFKCLGGWDNMLA